MLHYIITNDTITVLIGGIPKVIDETHMNFKKVQEAIKEKKTEDEISVLMDVAKAITSFGEGRVAVENGVISYGGKEVHSALTSRIIALIEEGFDVSPFLKFMDNLYLNPSKRAVDETYGFLEACNLPITEDGCFLAYKKVKDDYTDVYSGTFDNSIGQTPNMPRYEVDEDSNRTCSTGLHVASYSYMAHYSGARIVICKINPRDVVAVPKDYDNAKMRVCQYEVVGEVNLRNDELPDNVIREEDIPNLSKYGEDEKIDEFIDVLTNSTFDEVKDYCGNIFLEESYNYMCSIKNSTSFWKDKVLDIMIDETQKW